MIRPRVPESWLPRLAFAGKALVLTSLLAAVGLLIVRAQRYRLEQPRNVVDLAVWSVGERPTWAALSDVSDVRNTSGLVGHGLPLYDRDAAEVVRGALESTPRVRRVVSMTRVPPDSVDVVLELRRPAAAVATPDGRWVEVDDEGVVLGPAMHQRPVREGVALRVITGGSAPPAAGGNCAEDVLAGVALCRLLDDYRDGLGASILRTFDEVDVRNHSGREAPGAAELLLRSAPSVAGDPRPVACVVEWGRLGTRHGEPAFESKAQRLERAIGVFGDFDGVARVRVAFDVLSVLPVDGPDGAWLPALADQSLGR